MTAQRIEPKTFRPATLVLAAVGVLAVAGLMAAMVRVAQGQVQQANALRSQWQGSPRPSKVLPSDIKPRPAAQASRNGGGVVAASLDRP